MAQKVLSKTKQTKVIKPSTNDREKYLDMAISDRLDDSEWIEKTKEQELHAYDLRTRVGQLSRELNKAEKNGDVELAQSIRRKKANVLEKLSEI